MSQVRLIEDVFEPLGNAYWKGQGVFILPSQSALSGVPNSSGTNIFDKE